MAPPGRGLSIVLLGYLTSDLGVGESARLWLRALQDVATTKGVDLDDPWTAADGESRAQSAEGDCGAADVRVLCFNADETPLMLHHPVVRRVPARWTIGVWHWELESLPRWMRRSLSHVDEVWAGSTFSAHAIAQHSSRRVRVMPPPVPVSIPTPQPMTRSTMGLPEGHLFFFEFDYRSVFERKNPIGVIESFRHAFLPKEGPILLIKSVNGAMFPAKRQRLASAVHGRSDIIIWDTHLPKETNTRLVAACDTYVSLHRSEGFGLTLAEAAALGKAVIATGYSGSMDFLNESTSLLVPYRLVPIGPGQYPYGRSQVWADPDTKVAAEHMRWAWLHPERAAELGASAQKLMMRDYSMASCSSAAQAALAEVDLKPAHVVETTALTPFTCGREQAAWRARVWAATQVRRARRLVGRWPGSPR